MDQKYIAKRSSAEYVDLDMQLRDVRCTLLSVSVHETSIVIHGSSTRNRRLNS